MPYVIETSIGLDRMFLATLSACLKEEDLGEGKTRTVLSLPPVLAPVKVAIFPLTKKDGLPEKAREIFNKLRVDLAVEYEEKDSIGKRYRRHDAIGTPYCITIDHQTLEDNTVTIRERDTMEQERVDIDKVRQVALERCSWGKVLG
ncbi:MAG: His/Gly/Thr/Pro-type tRNA ligase C-terminal domain-containing protein [Chitinophagales bacterium]